MKDQLGWWECGAKRAILPVGDFLSASPASSCVEAQTGRSITGRTALCPRLPRAGWRVDYQTRTGVAFPARQPRHPHLRAHRLLGAETV